MEKESEECKELKMSSLALLLFHQVLQLSLLPKNAKHLTTKHGAI